jgi:hypothetical protein
LAISRSSMNAERINQPLNYSNRFC